MKRMNKILILILVFVVCLSSVNSFIFERIYEPPAHGDFNTTSGNTTTNTTVNNIIKLHNADNIVAASANVWYNITWTIKIDEESTTGFYLNDINDTLTANFTGIVKVGGCFHLLNNDANPRESVMYGRIIVNGIEKKCLQTSRAKSFKSKDIDTLPYSGSVYVEPGDNITLQWRTTNTKIELKGNPVFDDPVSVSINMHKID